MDTSFAASQDPEESGWTSYFDDFFSNQKQEQYYSSYSNNKTILVSDAASFVDDDEKFHTTGQLLPSTSDMPKFSKKLDMIKKRSAKKELILYDDSLDDTASSPVNSPRIVQEADTVPQLPRDQGSDKRALELLPKEPKMMVQT